jgi:carboxypeptidase T
MEKSLTFEGLFCLLTVFCLILPRSAAATIPGYPCYLTVEETYAVANSIATHYPTLAAWTDIGDSWEKTASGGDPGYDIMVLSLTNSAVAGTKPAMFVMSSFSGRDYAPAELNTRFAQYLVGQYGIDPDVTWILDHNEIHLLLQANPDGRKKAEAGVNWTKNTNENYCSPTPDYRGASLDNNFSFQWGCCGGSSGNVCDETYRGPSAASEPEVQAVENYLAAIFVDQRVANLSSPAPSDTPGLFVDLQSYGQQVLWPWSFSSSAAPNGSALQTLGRKLAIFNGYLPQQSSPQDGTALDHAYGELGTASVRMEIGTEYFQSCPAFESTILPDNLDALLFAARVLRDPYRSPSGPEAISISLSRANASIGESVTLSATLDDTRFNNDNGTEPSQVITAARYYVNTPSWVSSPAPAALPMSAVDGSFDSKLEVIQAEIDTSVLGAGRHTIFLQGEDSSGNWGPVAAVFLELTASGSGGSGGGCSTTGTAQKEKPWSDMIWIILLAAVLIFVKKEMDKGKRA